MEVGEAIYSFLSSNMRVDISECIDNNISDIVTAAAWFKTGLFRSDIHMIFEYIERNLHSNIGNVRMQR
jgi:hypothetical protein